MTLCYSYCGDTDVLWELRTEGTRATTTEVSSAALYHLLATGVVSQQQSVRQSGRTTWLMVGDHRATLKRLAYGELLRKLFSKSGWQWYYKGISGESCGPQQGETMISWFRGGYLYEDTKVCCNDGIARGETPPDDDFVALEMLLFAMTQPRYASPELEQERPIRNLSFIHGSQTSTMAYIGSLTCIQASPVNGRADEIAPCSAQEDMNDEENEVKEIVESVKIVQEKYREAALRCFCTKQQRFWFYLGQMNHTTIQGPYDGRRMYAWFEAGWLSLHLPVWSTLESVASINVRDFKPLGRILVAEPSD